MKAGWWALLGGVGFIVFCFGIIWIIILSLEEPGRSTLGTALPIPVVCDTGGCLTTKTWGRHMKLRAHFANATQQDAPTSAEVLTTLVRQRLVARSNLFSPVTVADARRYREEILHLRDEANSQQVSGLSLLEYDQLVLLPFLQQESLRHQLEIAEIREFYKRLAQEHTVFILPFGYSWDRDKAEVVIN